jgi:hypothetical protein
MLGTRVQPFSGASYTVDDSQSVLSHCAYIKNPHTSGNGATEAAGMALEVVRWLRALGFGNPGDRLVVEWPKVYQGGKQKGDPSDLLPLAGVDSAVAALLPSRVVRTVYPFEWKGQVPKAIMTTRILARLSAEERAVLNACDCIPSLRHNVIDAIGIARFGALGRS